LLTLLLLGCLFAWSAKAGAHEYKITRFRQCSQDLIEAQIGYATCGPAVLGAIRCVSVSA